MTKQIKIAISLITLFSSCFFAFSVSGSSITAHAQETEAVRKIVSIIISPLKKYREWNRI